MAGRRHHHAVGRIVALAIIGDPRHVKAANPFRRAENGSAERVLRPGLRLQQVEHQIVGRVVGGGDLLQDDVALILELFAIEHRIDDYVGQHIEREPPVILEHPRVIGGVLHGRRGIDVAARRLDLLGDVARRPPPGALEGHMLEEMRNAVLAWLLVARPCPDPDPERHRLQLRHGMGHDGEPVLEPRNFDGVLAHARCTTWLWMAPRSFGRISKRSAFAMRSRKRPGSAGRMPQAASTASGNFAGCAVASTTIGVSRDR